MRRIALFFSILLFSLCVRANLDGLSMSQITRDTQRWSQEVVNRVLHNRGWDGKLDSKEKVEVYKSLQDIAANQFKVGYLLAMDGSTYSDARDSHLAIFTGAVLGREPSEGEQLIMDVKLLALDAAFSYYENPSYFPEQQAAPRR